MEAVWSQIRPDETSGLIWFQTVCHSDVISERIFKNDDFEKIKKLTDDKKISEHAKSLYRDQMSMQGMLGLNFYGFMKPYIAKLNLTLVKLHARIQRGRGPVQTGGLPLKNQKNIGFL